MAAKRQRTVDTSLVFRVIDPTKMSDQIPGFKMIAATPGARVVDMSKQPLTHRVAFNTETPPAFWLLWSQFDAKMLRKEKESVPFTDFEAPLARMEERTFVLCDWTPEYEHLRPRLREYVLARKKRILDGKIEAARERLAEAEQKVADTRAELQALETNRDELNSQ